MKSSNLDQLNMNFLDRLSYLVKPGDLSFYIFTMLWPTACMTYILSLLSFSISESPIGNFAVFLWIADHEQQLLYLFLLLLLIEFPLFLLFFISFKTSYYFEKLNILFICLINTNSYAILLLQILKNIGILHYGVFDYIDYVLNQANILVSLFCFLAYIISLLLIALMVIGYFYRKYPNASTDTEKKKEYVIHVEGQFHVRCDSKKTSTDSKAD